MFSSLVNKPSTQANFSLIASSITSIEERAFNDCFHLTDMYCYTEEVPELGYNVFYNSNGYATLHVPAGSIDAYRNAEHWKDFKEIVALPAQEGETENDDYHPFVKEGKTWNYQEYYHNLWNDEQWTKDVSYVINGTKEIDGKTYYKMNWNSSISTLRLACLPTLHFLP